MLRLVIVCIALGIVLGNSHLRILELSPAEKDFVDKCKGNQQNEDYVVLVGRSNDMKNMKECIDIVEVNKRAQREDLTRNSVCDQLEKNEVTRKKVYGFEPDQERYCEAMMGRDSQFYDECMKDSGKCVVIARNKQQIKEKKGEATVCKKFEDLKKDADQTNLDKNNFCDTVRNNEVVRNKIIGFNPDDKFKCECQYATIVKTFVAFFVALYLLL